MVGKWYSSKFIKNRLKVLGINGPASRISEWYQIKEEGRYVDGIKTKGYTIIGKRSNLTKV